MIKLIKKKYIIILLACGIVAIILGIIFKNVTDSVTMSKIEIIDATYSCGNNPQEFYKDSKYIYYFPCRKSDSVYVKYKNGNKELVVTALENGNVTIDQLEKAGLKFYKNEK